MIESPWDKTRCNINKNKNKHTQGKYRGGGYETMSEHNLRHKLQTLIRTQIKHKLQTLIRHKLQTLIRYKLQTLMHYMQIVEEKEKKEEETTN